MDDLRKLAANLNECVADLIVHVDRGVYANEDAALWINMATSIVCGHNPEIDLQIDQYRQIAKEARALTLELRKARRKNKPLDAAGR